MIYSSSSCPNCKNIAKRQTSINKEIGNPFEKCPYCGGIYLSSYKQEWLTKSPTQRFFFFIQEKVWARAFFFTFILGGILISIFDVSLLIIVIMALFFIIWMILGYLFHKSRSKEAIKESLKRTENYDYVELLIKAKYRIFPIEGVKYAIDDEDEE